MPGGLPWEEVFVCRKCNSRCVERKETIQEIVDTEISYGKHLRIIKGVRAVSLIRSRIMCNNNNNNH